jgi:hypothetical protein
LADLFFRLRWRDRLRLLRQVFGRLASDVEPDHHFLFLKLFRDTLTPEDWRRLHRDATERRDLAWRKAIEEKMPELARHYVTPAGRPDDAFTAAKRAEAARLKGEGLSWPQIAERMFREHPEWFPDETAPLTRDDRKRIGDALKKSVARGRKGT